MSHALASTSNGIWVGTLLSFAGLSVAAALLNTPMRVGIGVVVLLTALINIAMWRRVELVPIAPEDAVTAKKVNWLLAGLYALFALFQ